MDADIEKLENEKAVLTEKLSDSSLSNKELIDAGNRLTEVISELEMKTERWLELSEFAE